MSASESQFGDVLFASAAGGLLGSLLAPLLMRFTGGRTATFITGAGYAVLCIAVASAPGLLLLGLAMLLLGLLDGAQDVTMNSAAVAAQQRTGSSLMGRMHATWSLSLTGAALLGAATISLGIPLIVHIVVVVVAALAVLLAVRFALPAPAAPAPDAPEQPRAERPARESRRSPGTLRRVLPVLGVAAFAASYVESPGQEWTGLTLSRGLHASPEVAALAPVLFAAGLVASRLLLDVVQQRAGVRLVVLFSTVTLIAAMVAGFVVVAGGGSPLWALVAVAAGGFGAGPIFPLLFGMADRFSRKHGIPPARTASIVSALSRIGAISAPLAVGRITESLGMAAVYAVMAAGALIVLLALPRATNC